MGQVDERQPTPEIPWERVAADPVTVARYWAKVHRRGEDECWFWIGAISDSGHGKIKPRGSRRTVTAHRLGWAIHYGAAALRDGTVTRHTCDETSCQNRRHWLTGERAQNIADYTARRLLAGHALADTRGAAGRAMAIRDAILAAEPGTEEAAIAAAIAAGHPSGDHQEGLW